MSRASPQDEDLVSDGWTDIFRNLGPAPRPRASSGRQSRPRNWASMIELADFKKMNQIRARVDAIVERPDDRRGAEALVPPVLQAADLQRRLPAHLQPSERDAGGHRGPRRRAGDRDRAWCSTASSTRWTASSSPPASRWAPPTRGGPASRSIGRDGRTLTDYWCARPAHAARLLQPRLPELLPPGPYPEHLHRRTSRTCWTNRPATSPRS